MKEDPSKRKDAVLSARRRMRKEMDQAWKDFFEKNTSINEEEIRRRIEKRSRSKQNQ